jgi:chromosome segregation ATPase
MKTLKNVIQIFAVIMFIAGATACNGSMNNTGDEKSKLEQKLDETNRDLVQEQHELRKEVAEAIEKFNERIDTLENNIKEQGKELDEATSKAIQKLKAQRDELQHELDKMGNETEEGWNDFKENLEQQTQMFNKAIEDFFSKENHNM